MIQLKAAGFALGCPWRKGIRDSINAMLSSLGWPCLLLRNECARLVLMFKLLHNFLVISSEYLPVPSPVTKMTLF